MSAIITKLDEEIKNAMKARNQDLLATMRLIKTAVKNKEIELIHPLSEVEFFGVLNSMAKQRQDSITQYKNAGREDLASNEQKELDVIATLLPKGLSEDEVKALIDKAIATTKATGPKDMGLLMKALKDETTGRFDGKVLSELVKAKLATLSA